MASIYIPPSQPFELYKAPMNCITRICNKFKGDSDILIYGDFNLPQLRWEIDEITNSMMPINMSSELECEVLNRSRDNGLYQIKHILNGNNRMLDLIWTNRTNNFDCKECLNHLLKSKIDHKAMIIDFCYEPIENNTPEDVNKSLYEIIDCFYNVTNEIITNTVKRKKRKIMRHPKWFDKMAINLNKPSQ